MEQLRADGSLFQAHSRIPYHYQSEDPYEAMGSNYCPSEFQAAVMLDQLTQFQFFDDRRVQNGLHLDALLSGVDGALHYNGIHE